MKPITNNYRINKHNALTYGIKEFTLISTKAAYTVEPKASF